MACAAQSYSRRREDNPYWEEEFELPEPELANDPNPPASQYSSASFIPIDLSEVAISNPEDTSETNTSPLPQVNIVSGESKDDGDYIAIDSVPDSKCKEAASNSPCIHLLTTKGIQSNLGQEIADLIVTKMILRLGPPLPLPPRDNNEMDPKILAVREKATIQMYAKWAATFAFQKLIVAIKLSLENFNPSHRGILSFEFNVSPF